MEDEEIALLASIRAAHPDEDTPRLVYADWLDEHDRHGHAEATREDVDLDRSAPNAGDTVDPEWSRRVDDHVRKVQENVKHWFDEDLGKWLNGARGTWRPTKRLIGFDRGMLVLRGSPLQFRDALRLPGLSPYVVGLEVIGPQGGYGDLAESIEGLAVSTVAFRSHDQYVHRVLEAYIGENGRQRGHAQDSVVRIKLGHGISNYLLSGFARWGKKKSLEEISVGPGPVGDGLSAWLDPNERRRLIDHLYDSSKNGNGIQPWQFQSKEVLKLIKYRTKIEWRQ